VPDAEAVFAQAVAAGAEVRQPLAEMFWGDLHGQVRRSSVRAPLEASQHLRDVPHTRSWRLRHGPSDPRESKLTGRVAVDQTVGLCFC